MSLQKTPGKELRKKASSPFSNLSAASTDSDQKSRRNIPQYNLTKKLFKEDNQVIFEEKCRENLNLRKLDGLVISIQENYTLGQGGSCLSCQLSCQKLPQKFSCKQDLGNVHKEGEQIKNLFSKLSKKVEHLMNPSVDQIERALKKLRNHREDRPVLFAYLGHGIEVNGMIHCPIFTMREPQKRTLYPIESKIFNLRTKNDTWAIVGAYFNCSRMNKSPITEAQRQIYKTALSSHKDRRITFAYAAARESPYRTIDSTKVFLQHLFTQQRESKKGDYFEIILPYSFLHLNGQGAMHVINTINPPIKKTSKDFMESSDEEEEVIEVDLPQAVSEQICYEVEHDEEVKDFSHMANYRNYGPAKFDIYRVVVGGVINIYTYGVFMQQKSTWLEGRNFGKSKVIYMSPNLKISKDDNFKHFCWIVP